MLTTFTFILALNLGNNDGFTVVVPNFSSLAACQSYGKSLYKRIVSFQRVDVYECVPAK